MARPRSDPGDIERRGDRRIVLRRRVIVPLGVPPQIENTPAIVFDISCTGIGLLAVVPLDAGAQVDLTWEFGPMRYHRTVQATVVHAMPARDGAWRVGCAFVVPLEPKELRAFLRHCARL